LRDARRRFVARLYIIRAICKSPYRDLILGNSFAGSVLFRIGEESFPRSEGTAPADEASSAMDLLTLPGRTLMISDAYAAPPQYPRYGNKRLHSPALFCNLFSAAFCFAIPHKRGKGKPRHVSFFWKARFGRVEGGINERHEVYSVTEGHESSSSRTDPAIMQRCQHKYRSRLPGATI